LKPRTRSQQPSQAVQPKSQENRKFDRINHQTSQPQHWRHQGPSSKGNPERWKT
jgi:hypothetical protein